MAETLYQCADCGLHYTDRQTAAEAGGIVELTEEEGALLIAATPETPPVTTP